MGVYVRWDDVEKFLMDIFGDRVVLEVRCDGQRGRGLGKGSFIYFDVSIRTKELLDLVLRKWDKGGKVRVKGVWYVGDEYERAPFNEVRIAKKLWRKIWDGILDVVDEFIWSDLEGECDEIEIISLEGRRVSVSIDDYDDSDIDNVYVKFEREFIDRIEEGEIEIVEL